MLAGNQDKNTWNLWVLARVFVGCSAAEQYKNAYYINNPNVSPVFQDRQPNLWLIVW